VFLDADYTLFAVLTLVLIIIALFFTILLLRSKRSTVKEIFDAEIGYTENVETMQETEAVDAITEETNIVTVEEKETPERLGKTRPTKECLHYLGYLKKLSTSSFPYECLACPKIGECLGEKGGKEPGKPVIDMSEYSISTRITATIDKTKNVSWKNWRGKNEQAIRAEKVPELYKLLRELGGKIKHNDWEYQSFERPVNMVVRTKIR
jgi:type II secretory pathway pseudopilin PulG